VEGGRCKKEREKGGASKAKVGRANRKRGKRENELLVVKTMKRGGEDGFSLCTRGDKFCPFGLVEGGTRKGSWSAMEFINVGGRTAK